MVSGTSICRPRGHFLLDGCPTFSTSQKLDFEVEFAAFVGQANRMGESIAVDEADEHIFGFVMLNDWSARDIQRAETGLMGPLNGKNFATSISPWIVPVDALDPFRTVSLSKVRPARSVNDKKVLLIPLYQDIPLVYLDAKQKQSVYDIPIDAFIKGRLGVTKTCQLKHGLTLPSQRP